MNKHFLKSDPQGRALPADVNEHDFAYDEINRLAWSRTLRDAEGNALLLTAGKDATCGEDVEACTALGPGWRMPSSAEAMTLIDHSRRGPATFDVFVDDTESRAYATSTPVSGWPDGVWAVYFGSGLVGGGYRYSRRCVRAVRSLGPSSAGQ